MEPQSSKSSLYVGNEMKRQYLEKFDRIWKGEELALSLVQKDTTLKGPDIQKCFRLIWRILLNDYVLIGTDLHKFYRLN